MGWARCDVPAADASFSVPWLCLWLPRCRETQLLVLSERGQLCCLGQFGFHLQPVFQELLSRLQTQARVRRGCVTVWRGSYQPKPQPAVGPCCSCKKSWWKTHADNVSDPPGLLQASRCETSSPGWGKPLLIPPRPENSIVCGFKPPSGSCFRDISRCQGASGELRLEMSQEEKIVWIGKNQELR